MKTRVIMIAHNQLEFVKQGIRILHLFAEIEDEDLIIIDNASEDGLREWLETQQNYNYLICDEGIESYSTVLNSARKAFQIEEDVLILEPCCVVLPGCIQKMRELLYAKEEIGGVSPAVIKGQTQDGKDFLEAVHYAENAVGKEEKNTLKFELHWGCILLKHNIFQRVGEFDEAYFMPRMVMWDFIARGVQEKVQFYECGSAKMFQIFDGLAYYSELKKEELDRHVLKQKWHMNYFNTHANENLLQYIEKREEDEFNVLEVGGDCGANLLWIKNKYPNAHLFGLEINATAAKLQESIAKVQIGNIEDREINFEGVTFDYIIFGDVLEHLRDPESTVIYCRDWLKDNGEMLASIPNLMHYSVLRNLICGNFTYSDMGLLDRTHIHFFTYKEIAKMFKRAKMAVIDTVFTRLMCSEEDEEFVEKMVEISEGASKPEMFYAHQYLIKAKKED